MLIVKNSELNWVTYDDWHNMDAGFSEFLPSNESADIMFARIKPGMTLGMHYHIRPLDVDGKHNGYESFFFYQGGQLLLLKKEGEQLIKTTEPFTITFFSYEEEMHGIKNIGCKDLVFQVVCAPKFSETEEIQIVK